MSELVVHPSITFGDILQMVIMIAGVATVIVRAEFRTKLTSANIKIVERDVTSIKLKIETMQSAFTNVSVHSALIQSMDRRLNRLERDSVRP